MAMTLLQLQCSVVGGLCTWLQVHETLINAGTTHHTRRLFLDGEIGLGPYASEMLDELVNSGCVPVGTIVVAR